LTIIGIDNLPLEVSDSTLAHFISRTIDNIDIVAMQASGRGM